VKVEVKDFWAEEQFEGVAISCYEYGQYPEEGEGGPIAVEFTYQEFCRIVDGLARLRDELGRKLRAG